MLIDSKGDQDQAFSLLFEMHTVKKNTIKSNIGRAQLYRARQMPSVGKQKDVAKPCCIASGGMGW